MTILICGHCGRKRGDAEHQADQGVIAVHGRFIGEPGWRSELTCIRCGWILHLDANEKQRIAAGERRVVIPATAPPSD